MMTAIAIVIGCRLLWTLVGVPLVIYSSHRWPGSGNIGLGFIAICPEVLIPVLLDRIKISIWKADSESR